MTRPPHPSELKNNRGTELLELVETLPDSLERSRTIQELYMYVSQGLPQPNWLAYPRATRIYQAKHPSHRVKIPPGLSLWQFKKSLAESFGDSQVVLNVWELRPEEHAEFRRQNYQNRRVIGLLDTIEMYRALHQAAGGLRPAGTSPILQRNTEDE